MWFWYVCHPSRKSSDLVPSTRKVRYSYLPTRAPSHKSRLHKCLLQIFISQTCACYCASHWASLKSKTAFPPKQLVEVCEQWFFLAAGVITYPVLSQRRRREMFSDKNGFLVTNKSSERKIKAKNKNFKPNVTRRIEHLWNNCVLGRAISTLHSISFNSQITLVPITCMDK